MITGFAFGITVAVVTGLAANYAWRRFPSALSGLAALLGTAVAMALVAVGAHLHVKVTGWAVPALIFGLIAGGQVGHLLTLGRPPNSTR